MEVELTTKIGDKINGYVNYQSLTSEDMEDIVKMIDDTGYLPIEPVQLEVLGDKETALEAAKRELVKRRCQ